MCVSVVTLHVIHVEVRQQARGVYSLLLLYVDGTQVIGLGQQKPFPAEQSRGPMSYILYRYIRSHV